MRLSNSTPIAGTLRCVPDCDDLEFPEWDFSFTAVADPGPVRVGWFTGCPWPLPSPPASGNSGYLDTFYRSYTPSAPARVSLPPCPALLLSLPSLSSHLRHDTSLSPVYHITLLQRAKFMRCPARISQQQQQHVVDWDVMLWTWGGRRAQVQLPALIINWCRAPTQRLNGPSADIAICPAHSLYMHAHRRCSLYTPTL